ncbi:putative rubber elongation factor [Dioscorea sansibarensis]
MGETAPQSEEIQDKPKREKLMYLDFVAMAAARAVVCLASLYNFAKENAGPLKSGVQSVEDTVNAVVGPVFDKFHDVPYELLKFVDRKVEGVLREVDRHVPGLLKRASNRAFSAAQKAPSVARSLATEVQRTGVIATATNTARELISRYEPVAKDLFVKYEPVAEEYAVRGWRCLNHLPLFPQVAQIAVPTGAYWSEKYNTLIVRAADQGYTAASYLPLVPLDRIAKAFGNEPGSPVANSTSKSEVATSE